MYRLVYDVTCFAESFMEYLRKAKQPPRPTDKEIYEVDSSVLGLFDDQVLRVVKRFTNDTIDEFDMLKSLPDDQKKLNRNLLCIDD